MAYVYRGTTFTEDDTPTPGNRCGTYAGSKAHRRRGEKLCPDCRNALNAYNRDRYEHRKKAPRPKPSFNPERCGTYSNLTAHHRYGIPACDACRKAGADYMAAYRERRKK